MRLAALSALQKDQATMTQYLDRAMNAQPNALAPRIVKARLFMTEKQPEKVIGLFQGLDQSVNQSSDALFVISKSQLAQKKYTEARFTLEKLANLKPKSALVQNLLAQSYAGVKSADKMELALEKALELRPDYVDARVSLVSYLMRSKPEQAAGSSTTPSSRSATGRPEPTGRACTGPTTAVSRSSNSARS
jgi:tetratricopeptide (TPR) repeat protein